MQRLSLSLLLVTAAGCHTVPDKPSGPLMGIAVSTAVSYRPGATLAAVPMEAAAPEKPAAD